jgi:hypothetical protein
MKQCVASDKGHDEPEEETDGEKIPHSIDGNTDQMDCSGDDDHRPYRIDSHEGDGLVWGISMDREDFLPAVLFFIGRGILSYPGYRKIYEASGRMGDSLRTAL